MRLLFDLCTNASQSVKTSEGGEERGEERGVDVHKQVPGRKRHIIVDTLGLVLLIGRDNSASRLATLSRLQVEVPSDWSLRRLAGHCGRVGDGVLLASVDEEELGGLRRDTKGLPEGACTTAWDLARFPDDYVMLEIARFDVPEATSALSLPIDLRQLSVVKYADCRCEFRLGFASSSAQSYSVRVWLGSGASEPDRRLIAAAVRSIKLAQ